MDENPADKLGGCPRCGGKGLGRNPKHFFYGICLIASGVLAFFQWPPAPELFTFVREVFASLHLSPWLANTVIWLATGMPPILGLVFIYAWLNPEICPCQRRVRETPRRPRDGDRGCDPPTLPCKPEEAEYQLPSRAVGDRPEGSLIGALGPSDRESNRFIEG